MSAAFVVDCSAAMPWLFSDEATAKTTELLNRLKSETGLVPALWFIEIANVLAVAERKSRITPQQSAAFITDIGTLDIEIDNDGPTRAFSYLLPLCRMHKLSSYDATYLDLALRREIPLATLDEALRKAARALGVKLLGL